MFDGSFITLLEMLQGLKNCLYFLSIPRVATDFCYFLDK